MKRIEWIDIFKGILIILVVFGHATQGIQSNMNVLNNPGYESVSFIKNMIYSFHMPAFFIASGLLFNSFEKKLNIEYLAKKVKKLLIRILFGRLLQRCLCRLLVEIQILAWG